MQAPFLFVNDIPAHREVLTPDYNCIMVRETNPESVAQTIAFSLPHLGKLKPVFAEINQKWIEENSMLDQNIDLFLQRVRKEMENMGDEK